MHPVQCTCPQREQSTGGPRVPRVSHRRRGKELRRAGAHGRWPLSTNRVLLRVLLLKANPMSPYVRPRTDRASLLPAMVERWRCSPSAQGAGPAERDWEGLVASRCRGKRDALARRHRKARWPHAQRRRSRLRRRRGRAGSHHALPGAWRRVPQRRSDSGARGRRNRRMARA